MGSPPTSNQSTVTPAHARYKVLIQLLPIIVGMFLSPLWIQSEAKGMNKAGYKR